MRIYCDGVFDLFHAGHLRHLETLASIDTNVSPCPLILDEEFIASNKIDAVYHAFASKDDSEAQSKMFALCKCQ